MDVTLAPAPRDDATKINIVAIHRGTAIYSIVAQKQRRRVFGCILAVGDRSVRLDGENVGEIMAGIDIAVARFDAD